MLSASPKDEGAALTGVGTIRDKTVMLAKPQTFMNLAGRRSRPLWSTAT